MGEGVINSSGTGMGGDNGGDAGGLDPLAMFGDLSGLEGMVF